MTNTDKMKKQNKEKHKIFKGNDVKNFNFGTPSITFNSKWILFAVFLQKFEKNREKIISNEKKIVKNSHKINKRLKTKI